MKTTTIRTRSIQPPHDVTDTTKLAALVAAMEENGWQGRPLLVLESGDHYASITGSHRLAAAEQAELEEVPCLLINTEAFYGAGYEPSDMWDDEVRLAILEEIGDEPAMALMRAEIAANEEEA